MWKAFVMWEAFKEMFGMVMGFIFPIALAFLVITVPFLKRWGVGDTKFEKYIDDNKTLKQLYYDLRPEEYKMKYTDWEQFAKDK